MPANPAVLCRFEIKIGKSFNKINIFLCRKGNAKETKIYQSYMKNTSAI